VKRDTRGKNAPNGDGKTPARKKKKTLNFNKFSLLSFVCGDPTSLLIYSIVEGGNIVGC
jgi:hypothetical protein